jgi:ATP-dependent RNA helicase RhlE
LTVRFADLPLIEPLQRALAAKNYTHPTPIQAQAIPPVLNGQDLLGCAQTGTGKTAAFALPILQLLSASPKPLTPLSPRVLVLAPTRELAAQIGASFAAYGRFLKFKQAVVYGGVGIYPQIKALSQGADLLVATPGRLVDLMQQRAVRLDRLEIFVLDEADRMLDLGFWPDLQRIMQTIPAERHSLFFSATMPPAVAKLAQTLLRDPVRVDVTPPGSTVDRIDQKMLQVERPRKTAVLKSLLRDPKCQRALVFIRTKHGANRVAEQLAEAKITADAIHGNKSQTARERTLAHFKTGKIRVLVATDLAARGIDVAGITHVINYDLPLEAESYVHRIGRTARAGKTGQAISLFDPSERPQLQAIERVIGRRFEIETPANSEPSVPGDDIIQPEQGHRFQHRRPSHHHGAKKPARHPGHRHSEGQPQKPKATAGMSHVPRANGAKKKKKPGYRGDRRPAAAPR